MSVITRICAEFSLSEGEVQYLLDTAPSRYKVHYIEKRNGRGLREIAQPTAEIKLLQRWVAKEYLSKLPVHPAAKAYVSGSSIKQHAEPHARNSYLLKLDFQDFFPSIKGRDFSMHMRRFSGMPREDIAALVKILFWRGRPRGGMRLSIGAPSSPMLSNAILYEFDCRLSDACKASGVFYTRYADDIALSTNNPRTLDQLQIFVQDLCSQLKYPRLAINKKKTVFTSKKHNRQLTGLVLSNEGKASLGREKKRLIRSMAHKFTISKLDGEQVAKLRGLLSFARSIDEDFIESIRRMMGAAAFSSLWNG